MGIVNRKWIKRQDLPSAKWPIVAISARPAVLLMRDDSMMLRGVPGPSEESSGIKALEQDVDSFWMQRLGSVEGQSLMLLEKRQLRAHTRDRKEEALNS
jgi:hypothetical protein